MKLLLIISIFALAFLATFSLAIQPESDDSLPVPPIDVYIVPHSHDDVGWQETPEEYYNNKVQSIYSTVTSALNANPQLKFIAVETWFIQRWWNDENVSKLEKDKFKELVEEGRVEIVNGGWCMNDGAISTYEADIDQMTLGHLWIFEHLGVRPDIGWHIDPFGSSSVVARLMADMGFNVFVNSRIPIEEQAEMEKEKKTMFVWKASSSPSSKDRREIFTMNLGHHGYCSPWVMDWDLPLTPPFLNVTAFYLAMDFIASANERKEIQPLPTISLFPWGCDFQFTNAVAMYSNMSKLIAWLNDHQEFNATLHYNTLTEYFSAVHDANWTWSVRDSSDFFPYNTDDRRYWTGFYTSRALLKGIARKAQNVLQNVESLMSWARLRDNEPIVEHLYDSVFTLRDASGVVQHHDALTGTEGHDYVVDDYIDRLDNGIQQAGTAAAEFASRVCASDVSSAGPDLTWEKDAIKNIQPGQTIPVVVSNTGTGWTQSIVVELPIASGNRHRHQNVIVQVQVVDEHGVSVPSQIVQGLEDKDVDILFFEAVVVPGVTTYFVECTQNMNMKSKSKSSPELPILENDRYKLAFDEHGSLLSITDKSSESPVTVKAKMGFWKYTSDCSTSYVFCPTGPAVQVPITAESTFDVVDGPVVKEVRQTVNSQLKSIVRLYSTDPQFNTTDRIEILQEIGPLDPNTEIITRIETDIKTNGKLVTENNGLETQIRQYNGQRPIQGNYYPMTSWAAIQGPVQNGNGIELELALLTDRGRGVASLADGAIEMMMHRRTPEYLVNDTSTIIGRTWIGVGDTRTMSNVVWRKRNAVLLQHEPSIFIGNPITHISDYTSKYLTTNRLLMNDLPPQVHFSTLQIPVSASATANERENQDTLLLRLVHLMEHGEGDLASPVTLSISSLLPASQFQYFEERSLNAVWKKSDVKRWVWKTETAVPEDTKSLSSDGEEESELEEEIILEPMDIKVWYISSSK